MTTLFLLHVLLFSVFAIGLTTLPKQIRATCFYAFLTLILFIGGFLGNAYSLPVFGDVIVSGGNLVYGAFMMTSILFVLAERDSFILRRIIQLVIVVDIFGILMSYLIVKTFGTTGVFNPHGTPAALFEASIPLIALGGAMIIIELGIMLFVFEMIKRLNLSPLVVRAGYLVTFVVVLCLDGILFPLIAFGMSEQILAIVAGGLSGKFLTACSYGLAIMVFTAAFPKTFLQYQTESVFTWSTLLSTSSEIIRDLEQKDAQLVKTESRILQSAKLAGLGYAVKNQKTNKVLECDEAYAKMHGMTVEEFTSLDIDEGIIRNLIHQDDRQDARAIRSRLLNGEVLVGDFRYVLPDGNVRSIRKIFSPLDAETGLYEVVCQDVTESRELQEKLHQTQKMDAIGNLTGGVAHDFNNLLAVILGNLELLEEDIDDVDQKELIETSIDATLRGAELTRNMLSFARRARLEPTVVDLNQLVLNMKNWIARTLPSTIDVETSLLAGLWPIKVDASSTESGLLNLIVNARDAMPQGGNLTIETSNVRVDDDYVELRSEEIEPGRYVLLAVSDTGEGIAPEILGKIFEPFYTTKPVGSGSGLGLSMLEGFMRQSGGTVRVYSEPGVGTTFKLYFAAAEMAKSTKEKTPISVPEVDADSSPTILLVEDNIDVLAATHATLVNAGYNVIDAVSGDEALTIFEQQPDIQLLLTDIVMPGDLQGTTLAERLREKQPDLPVVFMSGYASEATVHGNGLRPEDIRLMKPIRRTEVLTAISKSLRQGVKVG